MNPPTAHEHLRDELGNLIHDLYGEGPYDSNLVALDILSCLRRNKGAVIKWLEDMHAVRIEQGAKQ